MIESLLDSGSMDNEASDIAEVYEDMTALVAITKAKIARITAAKGITLEPNATSLKLEARLNSQLQQYFRMFGEEWADASFASYPSGYLLRQAGPFKSELTRFLRSDPSQNKIEWINDVVSEHDYTSTAKALTTVAQQDETSLWNKKVELSIAKLALAATNETQSAVATPSLDEIQLVKIQEQLHEYIRSFLYNAVDEAAELELAMEIFGGAVKDTPNLGDLLEQGIDALLRHQALDPDQLIDILTLMNRTSHLVEANDMADKESYYALRVLKHSGFAADRQRFDMLLKIIWQRCFLRDDWDEINDTSSKADEIAAGDLEATKLYQTMDEGYMQGKHVRSLP